MIFEQFEERGLSHYSYAVGCKEKGQIAIIDPRFDVEIYLDYAEKNRYVISHVFETHIHADYASGAQHLAKRAGAILALSGYDKGEKYEVTFPHKECFDGDLFQLGSVTIKVLHTPGHTPEHISFLALEEKSPKALFSGDFLFVGSLGRPDLIGEEATEGLAKQLYHSVQTKLHDLPHSVEIYPSHGAGSFCGGGMASRSSSTLGHERITNLFLKSDITEKEFVELILSRIPFRPDYFLRMKTYNSSGIKRQPVTPVPLECLEFKKKIEKGAVIIDLRKQQEFSQRHIPGSTCIGEGDKLGFWASMIIPYDTPIVIVTADPFTVSDAIASLARVGLTQVEGYLKGGIDSWEHAGGLVESIPEMTPEMLYEKRGKVSIIDVRSKGEWAGGHIENAYHIPCNDLSSRIGELPEGELSFICAGGYRSILAASLAKNLGRKGVSHLPGGVLAWHGAGLPLTL
ncbi:MAG: MBL fold metallo-hydrolase [Chlamydiia bacterium]|nr:MBL fold metallo-hydrolase [Chlamydiia bacterium]